MEQAIIYPHRPLPGLPLDRLSVHLQPRHAEIIDRRETNKLLFPPPIPFQRYIGGDRYRYPEDRPACIATKQDLSASTTIPLPGGQLNSRLLYILRSIQK